ncbi:hypothetical protein Sjap_006388 [Stephania japonica]|uniref:Uncharacterized protein n=1 Tax=Stephania japonica TaxID=461633 RepID=A0AAP0PLX9_9MAGN
MAESNRKQQDNAVKNSDEYDIEVLNGNENEYIEMANLQDFLLGVADPHTPEAVAAAESTILGSHSVVDLVVAASDSCSSGDDQAKKRLKIQEL